MFPAIAIAHAIKEMNDHVEILFVGAIGKLEMTEVPKAGYKIEGLKVAGFQRKLSLQNIIVLWKLMTSLVRAYQIVNRFAPDVVVGVGGYASGPVMRVAAWKRIPLLIQEQNSYPGITNRLMASKANVICVAFPHVIKYFNNKHIEITGNPVRKNMKSSVSKMEAYKYFNLDPNKKTLCFFGGSLGARTINDVVLAAKESIMNRQDILYGFSDEMYRGRIAKAIVKRRDEKQIKTTFELVDIIASAVPTMYRHRKTAISL